MNSPRRWRNYKPSCTTQEGALAVVLQPSKPAKPLAGGSGWGTTAPMRPPQPATAAHSVARTHTGQTRSSADRDHAEGLVPWGHFAPKITTLRFPDPTRISIVPVEWGRNKCRMDLVRHNCSGTNARGQAATVFPYCMIALAAWNQRPFDLSNARWYDTPQNARMYAEGRSLEPPPVGPDDQPGDVAEFADNRRAQIRRSRPGCFQVWLSPSPGKRFTRVKNSACVSLNQARRTAEHWYGPPVDGWRAPTEEVPSGRNRPTPVRRSVRALRSPSHR